MPSSLIATIAAGFTCAWVLGLLTQRLGLSPLVGYLLAGVLIGPHTPGFVGDLHSAQQLAEVGVILLMFGVGMHFRLADLLAVKAVAIPGAVGQSVVAAIATIFVFQGLGMPTLSAAVMGMALAVASTVVLMRVLMDAQKLETRAGRVAVGWLIVEDVFTVVLLVLIPVLAVDSARPGAAGEPAPALWQTLGLALLKLAALVAVVFLAGSRLVPGALVRVAKLRSRELFTLTVLVFSVAIAAGSYYVFGASMALGAFLAGMVVAQSPVSHQAAADALPMRDAFAVLFFVSVGMLFDPRALVDEPWMVLGGLGVVLVVKPLAALFIVSALGHSARVGLTVALGLAQIGEFSFILSELARRHGLMTETGHSVVVAVAILSITVNPLLFRALPALERGLRARPLLWKLVNGLADRRAARLGADLDERLPTSGRPLAVVVGYGPVGQAVRRLLGEAGLDTVVVELDVDKVAALAAEGRAAVYGDASSAVILEQAGVRHATHLVSTITQIEARMAIVATARHLNPRLRVLVRARYLREREALENAGATLVLFDEAEAAVGLARFVLGDAGLQREATERRLHDLRLHLIRENVADVALRSVRGVMVPWQAVRWIPAGVGKADVLRRIAQHRFTRWPVFDPASGSVLGYVLAKDLISTAVGDGDWASLIQPLPALEASTSVGAALDRMQAAGGNVCTVEEDGRLVGLLTLEDIAGEAVGRMRDARREEPYSLRRAIEAGAVALDLPAAGRDELIRALAARVPAGRVPPGVDVARLALAREAEISTDLGNGVAVPHARCLGLAAPVVVLGLLREGVLFSPRSPEIVRIVFLLLTPADQPAAQLALLAQIARFSGDGEARSSLLSARDPLAALEALAEPERRQAAS